MKEVRPVEAPEPGAQLAGTSPERWHSLLDGYQVFLKKKNQWGKQTERNLGFSPEWRVLIGRDVQSEL
ncbi:hypothetical protein TNCV_4922961 [Trichonephila clavipes]|nr:hypothetical protein TNCV_4922961 [Trichonephila clavipes]